MTAPTLNGRAVHVFTSDFLPYPGLPTTAGSTRSKQLITALQKAGHKVSFSMPLTSYLASQHLDKILPHLTEAEKWCCDLFFEPEAVLNYIQPDIAIYCNINCFRTLNRFAKNIVHIVDANGPLQFEALLGEATDYEAVVRDGSLLKQRCQELIDRLKQVDYLITVSERQKYFWAAYCSLAGFSFNDLNILVCPFSIESQPIHRLPADSLTMVYAGGFYPWQNPSRGLRTAAAVLEDHKSSTLHIFGGAHGGLANEGDVNLLLSELQRYRCVKYHGFRPLEELRQALSTAWCALDVMEQNIERELAINGRTLEFLATGTPVIHNDYSTLSGLIEKYGAGWTISPNSSEALQEVIGKLVHGGRELVEQLSSNARRLAQIEFQSERSMAPLIALCGGALEKRLGISRVGSPAANVSGKTAGLGRVLAVSPGESALLDLRIRNPLRALQRQSFIEGFTLAAGSFEMLKDDQRKYEAILVQRAVPAYVYLTLANLQLPFILDVDDNMLARPSYRTEPLELEILKGLRHATALTVPNPRTVRMLEKYGALSLAHKTFLTPNALPFPAPPSIRESSQPTQIFWIQSDIAALTHSRDTVTGVIEEFSRRHQLPILLIGKRVLNQPAFTHQVAVGEIDFASNLQLLEFARTSIGVAPLETEADQETLDFIAAKSDLKMVLFAGYGHAGVYSNSEPYSESPLRDCGSIVENSHGAWMEALEYQFREGWRNAAAHTQRIQEERHVDQVAQDSWRPALEACRFHKPVRGGELYEALSTALKMDTSPAHSIGYMVANEDVLWGYLAGTDRSVQEHYAEHGRAEGRLSVHDVSVHEQLLSRLEQESAELTKGPFVHKDRHGDNFELMGQSIARLQHEVEDLRSSYSWRITAPLRRLAKAILEQK